MDEPYNSSMEGKLDRLSSSGIVIRTTQSSSISSSSSQLFRLALPFCRLDRFYLLRGWRPVRVNFVSCSAIDVASELACWSSSFSSLLLRIPRLTASSSYSRCFLSSSIWPVNMLFFFWLCSISVLKSSVMVWWSMTSSSSFALFSESCLVECLIESV